jgi:hypothetical protein
VLLVLPWIRNLRSEPGWKTALSLIAAAVISSFFSPALFLVPLALDRIGQPSFLYQLLFFDGMAGACEALGGLVAGTTYYALVYRKK